VNQDWSALQFVSEELQGDRDVVLAEVNHEVLEAANAHSPR
jgi:hypothetical protein